MGKKGRIICLTVSRVRRKKDKIHVNKYHGREKLEKMNQQRRTESKGGKHKNSISDLDLLNICFFYICFLLLNYLN